MSMPETQVPGRKRGRGLIFGAVWLIFLASPVSEALQRHPDVGMRAVVIAVTSVFCLLYIAIFPLLAATAPARWVGPALLAGLALTAGGFCLLAGEDGIFSFVFLGAAGGVVLSERQSALWTGTWVGLTVLLPLVVPGWTIEPSGTMSVLLGAMAASGFVQLLRRNWELREAQSEIARLAVADERLRFSRDLHDILGHSLTVITVKSELAGRLVEGNPDRAATEIADVERLAREALSDVRATVAGYRASSLAAEVSQARRSLEAAGITAVLPSAVDEVTGPHRDLFGWVVREGITNVVRHSRATSCSVRLTPTSVEVVDDGVGVGAGAPFDLEHCPDASHHGNGLTGLRERVVAVGGTLLAGPRAEGGFRLRAEVPQ
ncbi:two-component system sensor histidine kinase DesK [Actinopolymorpha pittospori]|uniref:Two-component system sensor histidine kinase DesK n=2 Tax=Actinopolymorpha pittospori TaxID=648752 RepID=A0A927RND7_9ACTN|nr:two-component system sensor histidine kinase DesK [Actinopolymorpha pittospori]